MAKLSLHSGLPSLQNLGTIVRDKRGNQGLRVTAEEIGTSAPTLSRIESGKMPDLQTFAKLCRWLELDPASILGISSGDSHRPRQPGTALVNLRAKREISPETAGALAKAIVKAQQMLGDTDGERI